MSVQPIASAEVTAPTMMAICCRRGVAPTRKPVLRSWLVAPALLAATAMTPAMEMAPDAVVDAGPADQQEDRGRPDQRGDGHARDRDWR